MRITEKQGATYRVSTTDVAAGLAAGVLQLSDGSLCDGVTLCCETNPVRIALGGATPTQGASGTGVLLNVGEKFGITGVENVSSLLWISATNGSAGALQVMPEYF